MNLASLIKNEGRALPVFLLVDVSGSMSGDKIATVNTAMREMIATFRNIKNPKGIIKLCIITFGNNEAKIIKPLSTIQPEDAFELEADGGTPMGMAFETLKQLVEDETIMTKRDYTPTAILISDGLPTDFNGNKGTIESITMSWKPLNALFESDSRSSKIIRLAMGIGDDADYNILKAFINNSEIPVIKANDNSTITNFFKWVTMSVSTRSVSVNPNIVDFEDLKESFDIDSIVL